MIQSKRWSDLYSNSIAMEIEISNKTMYQVLEETVRNFPENEAISFNGKTWTYAQLKEQVDALASALQKSGVKKGDVVALMLPNCPQYVISYYGILATGAVVVQVSIMLVERELRYIIEDSQAKTIIALTSFSPIIEPVKAVTSLEQVILVNLESPKKGGLYDDSYEAFMRNSTGMIEPIFMDPAEDLAVIQYTGGTTGQPKGVMLTHRNLVANIEQLNEVYKGTLFYGEERVFTVIPLFHSFGMTVCMNLGIYQGSCLILVHRFKVEEVLDTIKREKPTRFAGVPTMYIALNNHPKVEEYGLNTIKICDCGGAPLPMELIHEFEQKTGVRICEAYGLSEASPGTHVSAPFIERKIGAAGIPLPSTDFKVVDLATGTMEVPMNEVGELIVKGPQVMKGYLNKPKETANVLRDGWLYTGDIAKMDAEGYLFIVDRKKDMIIAGGYNIYPREVEEVLYEHPDILEAVVVGEPDAYRGETVKAAVVVKGDRPITADDIIAFCKENLSAYKVPKLIQFYDELPKSGTGKILRRALRPN